MMHDRELYVKRTTIQERLTLAGSGLYGTSWRARLAEGLGISRVTLWAWLRGDREKRGPQVDIDGELVALVERERDAAAARGMMLTRLRGQLIALAGKK